MSSGAAAANSGWRNSSQRPEPATGICFYRFSPRSSSQSRTLPQAALLAQRCARRLEYFPASRAPVQTVWARHGIRGPGRSRSRRFSRRPFDDSADHRHVIPLCKRRRQTAQAPRVAPFRVGGRRRRDSGTTPHKSNRLLLNSGAGSCHQRSDLGHRRSCSGEGTSPSALAFSWESAWPPVPNSSSGGSEFRPRPSTSSQAAGANERPRGRRPDAPRMRSAQRQGTLPAGGAETVPQIANATRDGANVVDTAGWPAETTRFEESA